MRTVKATIISILTIGLLAGSAVRVAAQDQELPDSAGQTIEPAEGTLARVIDLEAPLTLLLPELNPFPVFSFTQDGVRIEDIPVTPGEKIVFRIDNTTNGHTHNFYIGSDDDLSEPRATTEIGIADWTDGVQELEWIVPDDITGLKFGCTFPSHYAWMQGTFSVSP